MRWGDMRPSDNVEDRSGMQFGRRRFPAGRRNASGRRRDHLIVIVSLLFGVNPLSDPGHDGRRRAAVAPHAAAAPAGTRTRTGCDREIRPEAIRRANRGRHRGRVDRAVQADGHALRAAHARRCSRGSISVAAAAGDAPPAGRSTARPTRRSTSTPRSSSELSQPLRRARRLRAGLRDRARDRPPRAEPAGHDGEVRADRGSRGCAAAQRAVASGSSCRRTAMPACGASTRRSATCSSRATWRKGLRAASAVGDDTIQKRTQGYIVPDAFTHGTAEQRDEMVPHRIRVRRSAQLQHVRRAGGVSTGRSSAGAASLLFRGRRLRCPPGSARAHDAIVFGFDDQRHFLAACREEPARPLRGTRCARIGTGPISGCRRHSVSTARFVDDRRTVALRAQK